MRVLEVREVASLNHEQRSLLDDLFARHPEMSHQTLAVYVIEGITGTDLLQRLLVAPRRCDVRAGSRVECDGLHAAAGVFTLGDSTSRDESLEIAGAIRLA
jgi:hypothetical protein